MIGASAVAAAAAVVALNAPVPQRSINVCALLPGVMEACQPPDVRRSAFVRNTNPPTVTQVAPN
jgi:hypothetical protein